MNILLVGQGSVLTACAEVLLADGVQFTIIEPKDIFQFSSVATRLKTLGVHVYSFYKTELFEYIEKTSKPLLVLSISNTTIFPETITKRNNITIVNYHNALLSTHRGRNCEAWQIYLQEKYAGISWHYVDAGVDTGTVIRQANIPLTTDITSIGLLSIQKREAVRLFREIMPILLSNKQIKKIIQVDSRSSPLHFSWEKPNKGILNPDWMMDKIWAFLRAMDYGCLHTLGEPMIYWNGVKFTWKRYYKDGIIPDNVRADFNINKKDIIFTSPSGCIILSDYKYQ